MTFINDENMDLIETTIIPELELMNNVPTRENINSIELYDDSLIDYCVDNKLLEAEQDEGEYLP